MPFININQIVKPSSILEAILSVNIWPYLGHIDCFKGTQHAAQWSYRSIFSKVNFTVISPQVCNEPTSSASQEVLSSYGLWSKWAISLHTEITMERHSYSLPGTIHEVFFNNTCLQSVNIHALMHFFLSTVALLIAGLHLIHKLK